MTTPVRSFRLRIACMAVFVLATLAGSASAVSTTYDIGGGLDDGHACLSSAGAGSCAAEAVFSVNSSFAATGTIVVDDVANTADIDITLTTATMVGSLDDVTQVVFTSTSYSVQDWAILPIGNQIFGLGEKAGSITGTYSQLDAGNSVVGGPTLFGEAADFSALSCLISGGNGQCGFTVGALRDFDLPVAGMSVDFVHTFNLTVSERMVPEVPEPTAAVLFAVGLLVVQRRVSRR